MKWNVRCLVSTQSIGRLPVSRRSWRCMRLCWCPLVGWCARTERSWRAQQWPDCPEGGCKKYTAFIDQKKKKMLCVYPWLEQVCCSREWSSFVLTWGCSVGQQGILGYSRSGWCRCAGEALSSGRAVSVMDASGCNLGNQIFWQNH